MEFNIVNGKLIGIQWYDNSKSKESSYSQDHKRLPEFIYSSINWKLVPDLGDKEINVATSFSADSTGRIDSAIILRGSKNQFKADKIFEDEALRVIKLIPEWDVYYRKGKHIRQSWMFVVRFSEDSRKKYSLTEEEKIKIPSE
ncbi:hypothetical protein [Solitalea koreensis]|uniref:TonB protein C-terminal n=1 Tax=Solitalea koreensis TaxID=543615 RepID=A0A521E0M5_9SPHI|nr:hypothetical protein [Solitalea koreensis]SMO77517.1 hypothetical protein SAMN06265350_1105 [Solitalea koreensis]